jgi:hypothetical protein
LLERTVGYDKRDCRVFVHLCVLKLTFIQGRSEIQPVAAQRLKSDLNAKEITPVSQL